MLLALAASMVGTAGCRPEDNPPTAGEVLRDGVDYAIIEMRTFVTREGIRKARLEADTAEFIGETETHMRPVKLTFFDPEGRETTQVTADSGVYYELTEDMEAFGSVVVLDREEDRRLETEHLRFVNADDRLYGDVPFVLWSDGGLTEVNGEAFESDPNLDSVTVRAPSGSSRQARAPAVARPDTGEAALGSGFRAIEEPSRPRDSAGAILDSAADSAAARPDSAATIPDSAATIPDSSTVAPDSLATKRDSSTVAPDSLATKRDPSTVAPDSLATKRDSSSARPDSSIVRPLALRRPSIRP